METASDQMPKFRNALFILRVPSCCFVALALILVTFGSGCGLTSFAVKKNRLQYNKVMVETDRSELLLNIVRMRYRDTPEWLVPNSVNVQNSLQSTAAVKPRFLEFAANFLDLSGEMKYIETPTVSYTPSDSKFVQAMLAPVTPRTVFLLSYSGWRSDQILRLLVDSINGVTNASKGAAPTPKEVPEFAEFRYLVHNLQQLEDMRMIDVVEAEEFVPISYPFSSEQLTLTEYKDAHSQGFVFLPTSDDKSMILNRRERTVRVVVTPQGLQTQEWKECLRVMRLERDRDSYELDLALEGQVGEGDITEDEDVYSPKPDIERLPPPNQVQQLREEIDLTVRSLAQVLFFMSQGVEVPFDHINKGNVVVTVDPSGMVFDWQQVLGGIFQVRSCRHKPHNAAVAVKYRGYWFYIDDRDADSKSTFLMIDQLVDLQARAGGSSRAPVLTLPVSAGN
jgi:hypothetical protein